MSPQLYGTQLYSDLFANDGAFHTYAIWYLGDGKMHVSVDGVESGSGFTPSTSISIAPVHLIYAQNGSVATNQYVAEDWYFMATPQAT